MLEIKHEQDHLDKTIKALHEAYEKESNFLKYLMEDATNYNREMMKSASNDYEDLETRVEMSQYLNTFQSKQNSLNHVSKKVKKYEQMLEKPYFGRIDFKEKNRESESFYIGISNFMNDETLEIMVCDWRAPISNMFYEGRLGEMSYEAPSGTISGELLLKRHFMIENRTITHYYDLKEYVSDHYLLDVLSQNSEKRLYPIVQSIQKQQNQIIRSKDVDLLYVNGVPGSGKTIIALHRMAYLLYHSQKHYNHQNMMVISPNDFFKQYIEDVLPELGEEQVILKTFEDLIEDVLGTKSHTYDAHINDILNKRTKVDSYKNTEAHFNLIKKWFFYYIEHVHKYEDLYYHDKLVMKKEVIKNALIENCFKMPLDIQINKIKDRIVGQVDGYKTQAKKKIREMMYDAQDLRDEDEIRNETIKINELFYTKMNQIFNLNPFVILNKMKEHKDVVFGFDEKHLMPKNFLNHNFAYDDYYAILSMKYWITNEKQYPLVKHLVIDECQDYSYMQYHLFKQMFPKAKYTLLGDDHQSIHGLKTEKTHEVVYNIFKPTTHMSIALNTCYRSTEAIIKHANTYLNSPIESIGRQGIAPVITEGFRSDLLEDVEKHLTKMSKESYNSIAIVTVTAELAEEIANGLSDRFDITHLKDRFQTLKHRFVVLPIYYAKGLEFDGVIYLKDTLPRIQQNYIDYTAVTRAKHDLIVHRLK